MVSFSGVCPKVCSANFSPLGWVVGAAMVTDALRETLRCSLAGYRMIDAIS